MRVRELKLVKPTSYDHDLPLTTAKCHTHWSPACQAETDMSYVVMKPRAVESIHKIFDIISSIFILSKSKPA